MDDDSNSDLKVVDFGNVAVDITSQKIVTVQNLSSRPLSYRVSSMYVINYVDNVFRVSITSVPVQPLQCAELIIEFKPNIPGQSFTDYYIVDDTDDNVYRLTITGRCIGPVIELDKSKLDLYVCKNVDENRKAVINMVNKSFVETTYRWLLPTCGQGSFQEPLFLHAKATVYLPGTKLATFDKHVFNKGYKIHGKSAHLMENSLNRLPYLPSASVNDRFLDFGIGSVSDIMKNVSLTLTVTNHEEVEGYIEWMPDPDNVFLIDPIASHVPPLQSRMFTVRFRPRESNEVFGYLMCGDYQLSELKENDQRHRHNWFRIPCMGNSLEPCAEWTTSWGIPTEVTLPPTVPTRTTFTNFMLSNRLEVPMYFRFYPPDMTNYAVMPMCGIVPSRGWDIISVALEPKTAGEYIENWDIVINHVQKARIQLSGSAEISAVEIISSHGYNPSADAMYEFPSTITDTTNYTTSYLHNLTRMYMHVRVLNSTSWLGADDSGIVVIPPKEITSFHWWFFPKTPNMVYDTKVTLTCMCLIDDRPVGEPSEVFIHIFGFSELPDLRVVPARMNLHDIIVDDKRPLRITLFNYCSCLFTSKLYFSIAGMGDNHTCDRLIIADPINTLNPSNYIELDMTITPCGAGPRQINIMYTVLYRSEYDVIEEIQPITKTIARIWYDGVYPTLRVKRTIAAKCPVILSNHATWNIMNVDEFNKALTDCRPNQPLDVQLFAPDICLKCEKVDIIFILGCVYNVPVSWSLRREKTCDCPMVKVQLGISTFEMRHACFHREMVELVPLNGIVSMNNPQVLHFLFDYTRVGQYSLCYVLTMSNQRTLNIHVNILAHDSKKGVLAPLRRHLNKSYLAVLDCGRVPINNFDPVVRILWLYNPTNVYATWRLLKSTANRKSKDVAIRCMLYFAEVPPFARVAIPFRFLPTEMISYVFEFGCSFGYENQMILVRGEGGLPNCWESRLDMPLYTEYLIRSMCRDNVVYLSANHITTHVMPTRSLTREIISICNNTDHDMRFIWLPTSYYVTFDKVIAETIPPRVTSEILELLWLLLEYRLCTTMAAFLPEMCDVHISGGNAALSWLPLLIYVKITASADRYKKSERIANVVNIVMTPCWGLVPAHSVEWITMTIYTLQEPATFTTTVSCEILDLTERKRYQQNEALRRVKTEKCRQEFTITEEGFFHPGINDSPPYVLDLKKPEPTYIAMSVSVCSLGQRDGFTRLTLKQLWEQTPPYDLWSADYGREICPGSNNMSRRDIIRIIDSIIWEALHSKMFKCQLEYYAKEELPTYSQLVSTMKEKISNSSKLSKRITAGICDAIVNKALFHVYNLSPKREFAILEA